MRFLLDTHVLAWWSFDDARLPATVRATITEAEDIWVSSVSAYEISRKYALGKWPEAKPLVEGFEKIAHAQSFSVMALESSHAIYAGQLSGDHRDPFDRLIVAQAAIEGMRIVSADISLALLGATPFWK